MTQLKPEDKQLFLTEIVELHEKVTGNCEEELLRIHELQMEIARQRRKMMSKNGNDIEDLKIAIEAIIAHCHHTKESVYVGSNIKFNFDPETGAIGIDGIDEELHP